MKKAKFWFCPIWWDEKTNTLTPRGVPYFLLDFTIWLHHSMLLFASFVGYEVDNVYPIKIYK